ncbi:hypothetical protein B0H10DRAFT_1967543 [Mycena sp. CBHHK59/15]|nr:hypothetical protein B0H10DRAFT_1967543 [Mycena sp. CBHHK59/15]
MLNTLTVLLATAAAAHAASSASSAASASATSNPYIPTGISSGCQSYLEDLNVDADLTPCTSALIAAASSFGPGGSSSSASKSTITTALSSICSTSTSSTCSQSLLAGKLAAFYTACSVELTSSPNTQVKTVYDIFYALKPLLTAACATDDSGDYCVLSANVRAAPSPPSPPCSRPRPSRAARRASPRAALHDVHAQILTAYIDAEANTNYAPGIPQSTLMQGQTAIYAGVVNTCGSDFLTSTVKAAGGLGSSGTTGSSGAPRVRAAASVLAMLVGVVGVAVLAL